MPFAAGPVPCVELGALRGQPFSMRVDDPFVLGKGDEAHGYLDGAHKAWADQPEFMDFLDPDTPIHDLKSVERDLYLHHWAPWWKRARTVLDVGCGVGRFALPLLERGETVVGVDADLRSLQRLAWRAAGTPGSLELSWSSVHTLPDVTVDVAIVSEVLCYVPEVERALRTIASRVRPGGAVLLSLEARWGWALAPDAPHGQIEAALDGDGVVWEPGQGWLRTYTEDRVRALLDAAELECVLLTPTHYVTDGPLERVSPRSSSLEEVLDWDARCRRHPVWSPLQRVWTVVGMRR